MEANTRLMIGDRVKRILMNTLTKEGEEFFHRLFRDSYKWVEERHKEENTTALGFLKMAGVEPDSNLSDYLEKRSFGFESFFQLFPMLNQDIAYCSLNPGMGKVKLDKFRPGGPNYKRQATSGDLEELAWNMVQDFPRWALTRDGNQFDDILMRLRKKISSLPDVAETSNEDYIQVDDREELDLSYFGDVYHTRYLKFQSPGKKFVDKFVDNEEDYWREWFADELLLVNPSLILCGCKDVWCSVCDHLVEDYDSDIKPHKNSSFSKSYWSQDPPEERAYPGVYEINPISKYSKDTIWVVTHNHESWGVDVDKLEEHLEFVNDKLN